MVDAGPSIGREAVQRGSQVGGERRTAALVVDERQLLAGLRGETQHQLDHVVAVLTAHPRGAGDGRVGPGRDLAGELGTPVDRLRVRRVVLPVRPIQRAVEHVVGAHVDEMGADPAQALARWPTASAFTAKAVATFVSHASTAV